MAPIKLFECAVEPAGIRAAQEVLAQGQIAAGPNVPALERALGGYLGGADVVCVGDMTHALWLALRLSGVGVGDEVLTLALNCMSSNSALALAGARPVWVDVDPVTATMYLDDAAKALTSRTKAVVVYHVAGYPADVFAIRAFCDAHGLIMIEDANNALGASVTGTKAGLVGDYAVLSFYPNRQINGLEGGALVCRDAAKASEARRLRRFGIDAERFRTVSGEIDPAADIPDIGFSSPMNNVNAAVALTQVASVDRRLKRNRLNVARLQQAAGSMLGLAPVRPGAGALPAYWVWLVRAARRDAIMTQLKAEGIQCSRLHQRNDRYTGFAAQSRELPGTDSLEAEMFALPCGWWLDDTEIEAMSVAVEAACRAAHST